MKKTTYILIGFVIAGAVAIVASLLLFKYRLCSQVEMKTITIGETTETSNLEPFSHLVITGDREIVPGQDVRCTYNNPFTLNITGSDDITVPELTMNPEWNDYLSLIVNDDVLIINFDFHGVEPYKVKGWNLTITFDPEPITLKVPRSMLQGIESIEWVSTYIFGLASSLVVNRTSSINLSECRMDSLSLISDHYVTPMIHYDVYDDYDEVIPEPEYYGYVCTINLHSCTINDININFPSSRIMINGENNTLNNIRWIENPVDNKESELEINTDGVGKVEWVSSAGNKLNVSAAGSMTVTF